MSAQNVAVRLDGPAGNKGLAFKAVVAVAARRYHSALQNGVVQAHIVIPKSTIIADESGEPKIDDAGNCEIQPWGIRGKIASGLLVGKKAEQIVANAREAKAHGTLTLAQVLPNDGGTLRAVAESPDTDAGRAYLGKLSRLGGREGVYTVVRTAEPISFRSVEAADADGEVKRVDAVAVADLPKDAVIGGVEEMLPPPVKAEVAAPEPTPEDADDARRASAIGGSSAEPTSPTDDNAHAM